MAKNCGCGQTPCITYGEQKGITPKEKMMMQGRVPFDPKKGLQLEEVITEAPKDEGLSGSNRSKMDQLFRMGLANKDERQIMLRALKRERDALKDPLLRRKLYELLRKMMKIITDDQQIYRQFRQHVQNNKDEIQDVDEMISIAVNESFSSINTLKE